MPVPNGLSIDLEDWYQGLTSISRRFEQWGQYEERLPETAARLLDILSEYQVHATFFVLGYVAERHPKLVERIHSQGHEVAVHGYRHSLVYESTPDQFRQDTQLCIRLLQDITGQAVHGHRAPSFSIDQRCPWAFSILEGLGLCYDSSVVPTWNPLYGWPGTPRFPHRVPSTQGLIELPVSTLRVANSNLPVGGGFYARVYPLWFTRWAIRRIHSKGQPFIAYLHPWELDPDQPRPPDISRREQVSHYYRLRTTEGKLRGLLQRYRFCPLVQVQEKWRAENCQDDLAGVPIPAVGAKGQP